MATSNLLDSFPGVATIVQNGVLEQKFHEALVPALLYREDAEGAEEMPGQIGVILNFTRSGILTPNPKPAVGTGDATPQTVPYEQWSVTMQRYKNGIKVRMPTSRAAQSSTLLKDIATLAIQAGMSINRAVRDRIFTAALAGNTVITTGQSGTSTTVPVQSLAGLANVLNSDGQLVPASVANPISAQIYHGGAWVAFSITGATPTDPTFPFGPGNLTTAASVTFSSRDPVQSKANSFIQQVGGGNSIDAIVAADTLTLHDMNKATAQMRTNSVPTFPDGTYHAHVDPNMESELFDDPAFQRVTTALVEGSRHQDLAIGKLGGVTYFRNAESPNQVNTAGSLFPGETLNASGVPIFSTVVLGADSIREFYIPFEDYETDAGITGKIGNFKVTTNGLEVRTDRIKLVMRAPLNDTQDEITCTYVFDGDWSLPSDFLTGSAAQYKRAIAIRSA